MADSAFHTFLRWAAVALCAAVGSLAYARPPQGPHGGRAGYGAAPAGPFWRAPVPSAGAAPRGGGQRSFVITTSPYGHGGPRVAPAPLIAAAATPFRPVSDEARPQAHEGGAAYLRAGSIRADIARYNEERGPAHVPRPPSSGGRPPQAMPAFRN
ncbi:MAG: peptide-binding protein [Burkholderiales bacterium]|nr:peptide-binding protein [Burkholderiales bacterium]